MITTILIVSNTGLNISDTGLKTMRYDFFSEASVSVLLLEQTIMPSSSGYPSIYMPFENPRTFYPN